MEKLILPYFFVENASNAFYSLGISINIQIIHVADTHIHFAVIICSFWSQIR
jgi:hypothetical protein